MTRGLVAGGLKAMTLMRRGRLGRQRGDREEKGGVTVNGVGCIVGGAEVTCG